MAKKTKDKTTKKYFTNTNKYTIKTNSIKTLKMIHIKKTFKKLRTSAF